MVDKIKLDELTWCFLGLSKKGVRFLVKIGINYRIIKTYSQFKRTLKKLRSHVGYDGDSLAVLGSLIRLDSVFMLKDKIIENTIFLLPSIINIGRSIK
jgi:hypothetical protein